MKKIIYILIFVSIKVSALNVTGINAVYKNGQVFITWNNSALTNIKYTVYKSSSPITTSVNLTSAQNLGYVIDSSAVNKRLNSLLGYTTTSTQLCFRIDSIGPNLASSKGLFVATSNSAGAYYYAVTIKQGNGTEDMTIVLGQNTFTTGVSESIATPTPIWQQFYISGTYTASIYSHFVTKITTPNFPLMANTGSYAFNFSVCKTTTVTNAPLTVRLHGGGGNFLQGVIPASTGQNEFRLSLDDYVPTNYSQTNGPGHNTLWFGYYESVDFYSSVQNTFTGVLRGYTIRRVLYTIDWVARQFGIDTTRIYLNGTSAGAIGSRVLAFMYPKKFAGAKLSVPGFNLIAGNNPTDLLNPVTSVTLTEGQARSADYLGRQNYSGYIPLILAVNGKKDVTVGWSEKPPYYDSINATQHGGIYLWDMRTHNGNGSSWTYQLDQLVFRFKNNVSYPAFSNCSSNGNPGNGTSTNGDSIGSINARIDWNDTITDTNTGYKIKLLTKNLITENIYGFFPALDSCSADVTLRRVQNFNPSNGTTVYWKNYKSANASSIVQQGSFVYNGGVISLPSIKIYKLANYLEFSLMPTSTKESNFGNSNFNVFPNPTNGDFTLNFNEDISLNVINELGQVVQTIFLNGTNSYTIKVSNLPSGIYFISGENKNTNIKQKVIVIK